VDALVGRGYFLANHGFRFNEGEQYILRALELRPNDLTANNLAGDLYYVIGDRDRALKFETRAVELDPLDAVQQWDLARTYIDDANWEKALVHARRSSLLEPSNNVSPDFEITALIFLGDLHAAEERMGQFAADRRNRPGRTAIHHALIAAISEDKQQIESHRSKALAIIKDLNHHSAVMTMSVLANDMVATASHLQAVVDSENPIFWYGNHWTIGLVKQISEAGVELNFPPRFKEFVERRRGSPWESFRLHEEIAKARERRAAKKS
jgi:tetratricopeptide (TPR) repeat protein